MDGPASRCSPLFLAPTLQTPTPAKNHHPLRSTTNTPIIITIHPPPRPRPPDFRTTKLGRKVTHGLVRGLEAVGVAPKGSLEVATMLERAADGLVAGGKKGEPRRCA